MIKHSALGMPALDIREQKLDTLVVLGASNVSRTIEILYRLLDQEPVTPMQVMIAAGRGRSYGETSSLALRKLPGIMQCRLWEDLAAEKGRRIGAIITDIGNDIIYGHSAERIENYLEACIKRLVDLNAKIVMSLMPVHNAENINFLTYNVLKIVAPSTRRQPIEDMKNKVFELQERLISLSKKYSFECIPQQPHWYGLDPIHYKFSEWEPIWRLYLKSIFPQLGEVSRFQLLRWVKLQSARAADQSLWVWPTGVAQPIIENPDALSIYYY